MCVGGGHRKCYLHNPFLRLLGMRVAEKWKPQACLFQSWEIHSIAFSVFYSIKVNLGDFDLAVVESFPSMHKALGSSLSTKKEKKRKTQFTP